MKAHTEPSGIVESPFDETGQAEARARTVRQSRLRRGSVGLIILAGLILAPMTTQWPGTPPLLRDLVVMLGTLLIALGTALRLWAGLYIGGHKERELVTSGPYNCVRNPLYLGNLLAAGGITALTGSPVVAAGTVAATFAIYVATIRQEEQKLKPIFGTAYTGYLRRVPALLPRLACLRHLTHDATPCIVTHRSMARELRRCLGFVVLGVTAFLLTMNTALLG
jgi:protein-S-isoprenylcysteine O-methyltransferase Ste14